MTSKSIITGDEGGSVGYRSLMWLFVAGLLVFGLAGALQRTPGYMDAEYYYAGGLRLANGEGWVEPYLWNFLNHPASLPVPAFSYWMPLVSLLAAAGLKLAPGLGFWGARLPFLLLAAAVPPLAAQLAWTLSGRVYAARLAGVLALFPGFYLAYMTITDAFPLYMVLGGLFLLLAFDERIPAAWRLLVLGLLAGLMHLARADGVLWLVAALGVGWWYGWRHYSPGVRTVSLWRRVLTLVGLALAGYFLVMGFWYGRNWVVWGSLFPPGGGQAMWLVEYGQTMIYPASLLTPASWLAAGWGVHLAGRLEALKTNLISAIAVQGGVILLPFMLVGFWQLRRCAPVVLGGLLWLATYAAMSLVFPYAGVNGGFFHSGAAFQPLLWALAPVGVEAAVLWVARLRRWQRGAQVLKFMTGLLLVTGVLLSVGMYASRVIGSDDSPEGAADWAWNVSANHYLEVEKILVSLGAQPDQSVLVNNPPGYYLASGRPAVVIPFGDEQMLLAAARQYQVDYLVLEPNNSYDLENLYLRRSEPPELEYLGRVGDTSLYRIQHTENEE